MPAPIPTVFWHATILWRDVTEFAHLKGLPSYGEDQMIQSNMPVTYT